MSTTLSKSLVIWQFFSHRSSWYFLSGRSLWTFLFLRLVVSHTLHWRQHSSTVTDMNHKEINNSRYHRLCQLFKKDDLITSDTMLAVRRENWICFGRSCCVYRRRKSPILVNCRVIVHSVRSTERSLKVEIRITAPFNIGCRWEMRSTFHVQYWYFDPKIILKTFCAQGKASTAS